MNILSDADLLILIDTLVAYDGYYFSECNDLANDLAVTGCRPNELFTISRWAPSTESEFLLYPSKGNNTRLISLLDLSESFIAAVLGQKKPYNGLSFRQLMMQINRVNYIGQLYVSTKPIDAYMFRYNLVKQYANSGLSDSEIVAKMGWTNIGMVGIYKNAVLQY